LFVHFSLILLFFYILFIFTERKKERKAHHFRIESQKMVVNIDNKSFHLILLNIFLHLNIYLLDNFDLFCVIFFKIFIQKKNNNNNKNKIKK